jgi:hypothetical protein
VGKKAADNHSSSDEEEKKQPINITRQSIKGGARAPANKKLVSPVAPSTAKSKRSQSHT